MTPTIAAPPVYALLEPIELKLPFWRYYQMFRDQPYSFLLDSARDPEKLGRFSFLGGRPFLVFRAYRQPGSPPAAGARMEVLHYRSPRGDALDAPAVSHFVGDPFTELRACLQRYRVEPPAGAPRPIPFLGGAVGYFGYEAGYFIEDLPDVGIDDLKLPTICFGLHDVVLGHDHAAKESYLSVIGRAGSAAAAQQRALDLRDDWLRQLRTLEDSLASASGWDQPVPARRASEGVNQPVPARRASEGVNQPIPARSASEGISVRAHSDEAAYCRLVERCKEHIFAGDIFEVCLTHRLEADYTGDAWDLYQELRRINPAPFACYLNLPEAQVVSSSPERFLRLDSQRIGESRPIKGTRPRGKTPEEDEALYRELLRSVKDRAENVMIVDLVRNDFGRVCKFGSVHVPELMIVERYATVFQMVSTIRGELEDGRDGLDLIRACFPGGSMTGAPKIEAMKIIDRLEPVKRGIYSGSIGYLDFAGPLDLNIVIRTLVVKDGRCYFNVGGAIVADSDPADEYHETQTKAAALIRALNNLSALSAGRPGPTR